MDSQHVVVVSEHLAEEAIVWLRAKCDTHLCRFDDPDFYSQLGEAQGLIVRTYTNVDTSLLDSAPKLKVIGRAGAGLDNIDLAACRERGISVVYTPDANTQAVVEYVLRQLLKALRPSISMSDTVPVDEWGRLRAELVGKRQLSELTIGILGLGRIGKRLATAFTSLGCPVIFNDLLNIPPPECHGAKPIAVEALFEQADVLSMHIDGRPENRHFINTSLIDRMKSDVIFINTSRGMVVDATVLAKFMKTNTDARALIDVHEPEPFDQNYPLLGLDNVQLYPHLASRTETAMLNMSWVVKDVVAVLEGRTPEYPAM